ncbi:MAG TPA: cysteine desulfurase-like protein [Thermoanaerobaculia bacterium]|nr:cysteine desulfurase-like protein [Thermoanaerobaculia bacterium]
MIDFSASRNDFPGLSRIGANGLPLAYLDGPGGTQVPRSVIDAVSKVYETSNANTHGAFVTSIETDEVIFDARAAAADFLGAAGPETISFGQNMTTLNFALARAIGRTIAPGDEIVLTELDHEANRGPWKMLEERGAVIREIPLRHDGTLDTSPIESIIGRKTRLVAMGWASNALGTVNDLTTARTLSRDAGAWLLVDAVHYAPHFPIDVQTLDPDFLLCSAYKFYGPHVGILYSRPGLLEKIPTDRLITQESRAPERIETGTLNHAALAGVRAAIDYLASWGGTGNRRERIVASMTALREHEGSLARKYVDSLSDLPRVTLHGPPFAAERRAPTISITIDGVAAGEVTRALAGKGIAAWDGDFYARRAVEVLGLASQGGLVRCGMAMYTSESDVERLSHAIREIAGS